MTKIKDQFTLMAILLIPIGVAINLLGGTLAKQLQMWIFLDSIGTFLVAMLAGPVIGLITGGLSILLLSIQDVTLLPWAILAAAMGFLVGVLAQRRLFTKWSGTVLGIVLVVAASVLVSVLMSLWLYGGFTTSGISVFTGILHDNAGLPLPLSVTISHVLGETVDKTISILVPVLVIRALSRRTLVKFPLGDVWVDRLRRLRETSRAGA
jgi:energy-coupling factor transport system substrate-specific component